MLKLFRKKKPYEQEAESLYAHMLETACAPAFCTEYGVPDSMEARFDLLVLHASLIIERTLATQHDGAQELNQALFDIMFIDMDQTLRNMGVGDMGVPKRMRKMMKGFNGRVKVYHEAQTQAALSQALARNIYAAPESAASKKLAKYVQSQRKDLAKRAFDDILNSDNIFTGL